MITDGEGIPLLETDKELLYRMLYCWEISESRWPISPIEYQNLDEVSFIFEFSYRDKKYVLYGTEYLTEIPPNSYFNDLGYEKMDVVPSSLLQTIVKITTNYPLKYSKYLDDSYILFRRRDG